MENVPNIRNDKTPEQSIEKIQKYLIGLKQEIEYNLQMLEQSTKTTETNLNGVFDGIKETISTIESNKEYWDRIKEITNNQGKVITEKLEGDIRTSINKILNGTSTFQIDEQGILMTDQTTEEASSWAMRLGAKGFMIAGSKTVNAQLGTWSWDWKTFGTGKGFTADDITTGTLSAITLNTCTLLATVITSGSITGVDITGCNIFGSNLLKIGDVANGNYIEVSPNSPIKVWKSKVLVSSLGYSEAGGGKLVIYDGGGQEAFRVEVLDDGDLEMYINSSNTYIPDPEHPGFWIPNPNVRQLAINAGKVLFNSGAAGVNGGKNVSGETIFYPFTTKSDVTFLMSNDTTISDLKRRMSDVESKLITLSGDVSSAKSSISTVSSNLSSLSNTVSSLSSTVSSHTSSISSLSNDVSSTKSSLSSLSSTVSSLSSTVSSHTSSISSLSSDISSAKSNISSLQSTVSNIPYNYAKSSHSHFCGSAGTDRHTHSIN